MQKIMSLGLLTGLFLFTPAAIAHHSFSATFTDEIISVEGVVDRMSFSNPHVIVFFNVTDENGQQREWMSEGDAATLMRRQGWDANTLEQGDYIKVTGNSTRNGSPMVSMGSINFVDPRTGAVLGSPGTDERVAEATAQIPMLLADGRPNLSGAWGRGGGNQRPANAGDGPGDRGAAGPGGDGREGREGRGGGLAMPYNEIGAALQAEFDPVNDPQVQCEPPGLVRQVGTPHPVRIEQFDDHVVISFEEYGGVRTIYFDDRDLVGGEHSHLGQSIARYEGETLVIETTHLRANLTNPGGNGLSDQTTTIETYSRLADANGSSGLNMEMVITDPGHLTEAWTRSWQKYYSADYEFIEVDCHKPLAY